MSERPDQTAMARNGGETFQHGGVSATDGAIGRRSSDSSSAAPGNLPPPSPTIAATTSTLDNERDALKRRAAAYLEAGVPIHFRGLAGTGKTTLAIGIARERDRPVSVLVGGREVTSIDLLGRAIGEATRVVRDRYVQRVQRTETITRSDWRDGILAEAMANGHTLVYDEFTRTPPEANNALLSALEEGMLVFADPARGERRLMAHPDFRVLLTSNPHDYAGVCETPDALADRMVTFDLDWPTAASERAMVRSRTGLSDREAGVVVDLVRSLRAGATRRPAPSLRTSVLLARLLKAQGVPANPRDPRFVQVCIDVLHSRVAGDEAASREALNAAILATARAEAAA